MVRWVGRREGRQGVREEVKDKDALYLIILLSRMAVASEVCMSINLFFSSSIGRSVMAEVRRAVLSDKLYIQQSMKGAGIKSENI